MAVNFVNALGAGSGIDTKTLAESLVEAERAPKKERIDAKITQSESKISGYGALKFALSDLKTAFEKVNDRNEFSSIKALSTQPNAVGISTTSSAAAGTLNIAVTQVALATRLGTTNFTSPTDTLNNGDAFDLNFSVGKSSPFTTHTVNVASATPLDMARAVNSATATTGISAQLINTGSGFTLVFSGATGEDNGFTMTNTAASGLTMRANPLQTAQNAEFTVNDLPITRANNTVNDAVEGVTFSLYTPTSGSARIDLNRETTGVKDNIKALVEAYNNFEDSVKILSDRDSKVEEFGGALAGDTLVQQVRAQMRTLMTADYKLYADPDAPVDPPLNPDVYAARHVGISFDRSGKLQLDEAKLDTALQANFGQTVQLFTGNSNGLSAYSLAPAGLAGAAFRNIDKMLRSTGEIDGQVKNNTEKIEKYKADLVTMEDRLAKLLARYSAQFSVMDSIVGESNTTKTNLKGTFESMMSMYTK